jgi:hypothetical protein
MPDKTLYVPDSVRTRSGIYATARGPESEVMKDAAQLEQELYEVSDKLEYFNKEAKRIDPYLSIILAKPNAQHDALRPNYYHFIRRRPGHMTYIKVIENPHTGAWRDLDSSIWNDLREEDMWDDRVQREKEQKMRRAAEAAQRQKDREAMDRAGEFDERLKAATNGSILVPRSF